MTPPACCDQTGEGKPDRQAYAAQDGAAPSILGARKRVSRLVTALLLLPPAAPCADTPALRNERHAIELAADGCVTVTVPGMPPQRFAPEFTVWWSDGDPRCSRNPSHPNYPVAPRTAVRWRGSPERIEDLNAWVGSPDFQRASGLTGSVSEAGGEREWEYRDSNGHVKVRVSGGYARDTTRPFQVLPEK